MLSNMSGARSRKKIKVLAEDKRWLMVMKIYQERKKMLYEL